MLTKQIKDLKKHSKESTTLLTFQIKQYSSESKKKNTLVIFVLLNKRLFLIPKLRIQRSHELIKT